MLNVSTSFECDQFSVSGMNRAFSIAITKMQKKLEINSNYTSTVQVDLYLGKQNMFRVVGKGYYQLIVDRKKLTIDRTYILYERYRLNNMF